MRFKAHILAFAVFVLPASARIGAELQMLAGNPSGATADPTNRQRYLITREQYAMDYNDTNRQANWVAWNLTAGDVGPSGRSDFSVDSGLPSTFHPLRVTDYSGSGYDRGHLCPSADRTVTSNDNKVVFVMTNMIPQTPDNNQGPWLGFEEHCRGLAQAGNELLIIAGPSGYVGRLPSGVVVPSHVWKVVVVVAAGGGDTLSRITVNTQVIAIKVPNVSGIRGTSWRNFTTSVNQIQVDTGLRFFGSLGSAVASTLYSADP
jgi:endonuclease G